MKVTTRKLKQTWAYCDTDINHGKTPIELTIKIGDKVLKVWLCESCLNVLQNTFTIINIKGES
jgi:hypothetical protein